MTSSILLVTTRNSINCAILGAPLHLCFATLPTIEDVLLCYLLMRHELKMKYSGKEPSFSEVSQVVGDKIIEIWNSASIPIVSRDRVMQLIRSNHNEYIKLVRFFKIKRNDNFNLKVMQFKNRAHSNLFDIAACMCKFYSSCSCEKSRNVPAKEQNFLLDQRSNRKMAIGNIDIAESKRLQKKDNRKMKELERHGIEKAKSSSVPTSIISINKITSKRNVNSTTSSVSQPSTSKEVQCCSRNNLKLPSFSN